MMEVNHQQHIVDEAKVKAFLTKGLVDGPKPGAEQLLANVSRHRRFPAKMGIGIAAAVLMCVTFLSSLQVPALAQVLASMPIIGDSYTQFVSSRRLDIAYQAGLLQELEIGRASCWATVYI